jgi:hypothetical protein
MHNYPEYIPSPTERVLEIIGVVLVITLLLPILLIADLVKDTLNAHRSRRAGRGS